MSQLVCGRIPACPLDLELRVSGGRKSVFTGSWHWFVEGKHLLSPRSAWNFWVEINSWAEGKIFHCSSGNIAKVRYLQVEPPAESGFSCQRLCVARGWADNPKNHQNQLSDMERSSRISWQKNSWFHSTGTSGLKLPTLHSQSQLRSLLQSRICHRIPKPGAPAEAPPGAETTRGCVGSQSWGGCSEWKNPVPPPLAHSRREVKWGTTTRANTWKRQAGMQSLPFLRGCFKVTSSTYSYVNPKLPLCPLQVWKGKLFPPLSCHCFYFVPNISGIHSSLWKQLTVRREAMQGY